MTSTKPYWSILNNKKIPCNSPLSHQNKYVTDSKAKKEIFSSFFADQCSLINTRFFYKQHVYKQRQAEMGKKLGKSLAIPGF